MNPPSPQQVASTIKTCIDIINRRIDDWKQVLPEGEALLQECQIFEKIIVGVLDKPELPFTSILKDVKQMIEDTTTLITVFAEQDNEKRKFKDRVVWKIRRVYLARKYRLGYKSITSQLDVRKNKIQETLTFWAAVNKPTMHWYSGEMVNTESFAFWLEICGAGPYAAKWSLFIEAYRHHHPEFTWNDDIEERIRHVACSYSELLTIRGFIELTKKCDFPLNINKLPLVDCNEHHHNNTTPSVAPLSISSRMEITHMLNDLIIYNNSQEFKDKIQPVFTWYKGCHSSSEECHGCNDKAWQERADEWAVEMLKNRFKTSNDMNDQDKLVLAVDNAKQIYMSFFQRCMATIQIGQASKEMFTQVDFPSMTNITKFIKYMRPLDYAHYHIFVGADPNKWQSKQPGIYTFFNDLIHSGKKEEDIPTACSQAESSSPNIRGFKIQHEHAANGLSFGKTKGHSSKDDIELVNKNNMSSMSMRTNSAFQDSSFPLLQ